MHSPPRTSLTPRRSAGRYSYTNVYVHCEYSQAVPPRFVAALPQVPAVGAVSGIDTHCARYDIGDFVTATINDPPASTAVQAGAKRMGRSVPEVSPGRSTNRSL